MQRRSSTARPKLAMALEIGAASNAVELALDR